MPEAHLAIVQVTPFAWEVPAEVNEYVGRISDELAGRGHRVLILAPSESSELVRDTRRAIRDGTAALLERAEAGPVVLGVGEVLPFAPTRRRAASLPVDVARTIEETLANVPIDLVHVHEPFAPSASSVALRHSRALNVGSFHAPTERLLSTQLTRPLSRLLFSRLDARVASYRATRDLLQGYFPGDYEVILPGADAAAVDREPSDRVELLACGDEDRAALRTVLRAVRALPQELDWHLTIWSRGPLALPATLGGRLAERIDVLDARTVEEGRALADADIVVLASEGVRPVPGALVRALSTGTAVIASRLPVYDELLCDGEYGLQFELGDAHTLTAHLSRLISQPGLRDRARSAGAGGAGAVLVVARGRRARGDLRASGSATPRSRRRPRARREAGVAEADRRRPAHAHRPFV